MTSIGHDPSCEHPAVAASSVGPRALERAAALFRAAGDTERLRLLERLAHGEACVTELAALTQAGLSTISQRLRLLRSEGLVRRRRDGKHIYYALMDEHVSHLIASALSHAAHPPLSEEGEP